MYRDRVVKKIIKSKEFTNINQITKVYNDSQLCFFSESEVLSFLETEFVDCQFININFPSTDWLYCKFNNVVFKECKINGCVMRNCSLTDTLYDNCSFKRGSHTALGKKFYSTRQSQFFKCDFENVDVQYSELKEAYFKECAFRFTKFMSVILEGSIFLENCIEFSGFQGCNLSSVDFSFNNHTVWELSNNTLNGRTNFAFLNDEGELSQFLYEQIYHMYRMNGLNEQALDYYIKFREIERNLSKGYNRLGKEFLYHFWGYGEKPIHILKGALIVILFFALCYKVVAIQDTGKNEASFFECLYLSLVTFTTLGCGDINPNGNLIGMFIAGIEALTGIVFTAVGTATIYKKITKG